MHKKCVVMALMYFAANLSGCTVQEGPRNAADTFWKAVEKTDVQGVKGAISEQSLPTLSFHLDSVRRIDSYRLGQEEITGDKASVPVTLEKNGRAFPMTTHLIREDGVWKVDYAATLFSGMNTEDLQKAIDASMKTGSPEMPGDTENRANKMREETRRKNPP
jgi:hypothetical protein